MAWLRRTAACCLLPAAAVAWAQGPRAPAVALAGTLGGKALLVVNGQPPRAVAPGETHQGVRLLALQGGEATVEADGQRSVLRLGEAPARVGAAGNAPGSGRRIVMTADSAGHFVPQGSINGKPVQFLVDTGASVVGVGQPEADRIGIAYRDGQPVRMGTANGVVQGWRVKLATVRVGDVELREIDAVVMPSSMPYVLLGNSFLSQMQMTRATDQMVLERRL